MISASEPFEFVPHGRTVVEKHPGKIYSKGHNNTWSENSLLYKLTNFDIKDDSLIEGKDFEGPEWWTVREVNSAKVETKDESAQAEAKKESMSDIESRPRSRLKNDYNISIKSEIIGGRKREPGSRGGSTNSSSNMSKKFNLNGSQSPKMVKSVAATSCCYEEELYVKGCTAVWSKGLISSPGSRLLGPEARETIACYTLENPIKHAAFWNFHVNINNTMLMDALNSQIGDKLNHIKIEDTTEHITNELMQGILLIDNRYMRVYANDGREYVTSIPFPVKKVWPMKYGVILEKEGTNLLHQTMLKTSYVKLNKSTNRSFSRSESPFNMSTRSKSESMCTMEASTALPTVFSMGHPLDEVVPVLMRSTKHRCRYYNDPDLQIIFVSSEPSIVLIYDWKLFIHSLWSVRRANRDESLAACPNDNCSNTNLSQSVSDYPCTLGNSSLRNNSTNVTKSFAQPKKTSGTQSKNQSKAHILANVMKEQCMTPNSSHASWHGISPLTKQDRSSNANKTWSQAPPTLPLYPDICFDHIWMDIDQKRRDPFEDSSDMRTFLHTDLVGDNYLCYIVRYCGVSKLHIVRLEKSHLGSRKRRSRVIVGSKTSVTAKDAVPLERLHMIALIDDTGNIVLHSGTAVVGKVHVGGVLARLIDSPYSRGAALQSPFPRRSSLLPSRAHDAAVLDDSAFHLLSPVPHTAPRHTNKESMGLQSLCDPAGNCVTLRFDKGSMYRITLPEISSSSLVSKCFDALKAALPKEATLKVLVKWYGIRNAPGSQDISSEEEWTMFINMIYTLIGYNVEKMSDTKTNHAQSDVNEVVTKKQRTSSDGSHDDWDNLLNSRLHKHYGLSLALLLNFEDPYRLRPKTQCSVRKPVTEEKGTQFNPNAILLSFCMPILYSFHLIYEDMKLNTLLLDDMEPLSKFLYQLAKDTNMKEYVSHYWTDLPYLHDFENDRGDSQMSHYLHLMKLNQPSYITAKPPSLFAYLNSMWRDEDVGTYPFLEEVNNFSRNVIEVLSMVGVGRGAGVHIISGQDRIVAASTPRARTGDSEGVEESPHCRAVRLLCERGVTSRDIDNLPPSVGLYMSGMLNVCRAEPPLSWPRQCYEMVMREDLAIQTAISLGQPDHTDPLTLEVMEKENVFTLRSPVEYDNDFLKIDENEFQVHNGMEHLDTKLLRLLYPDDHRVLEVVNCLQSSVPVTIVPVQLAETSDLEFSEEQQKHLFAYATRTMSLPVARGIFTLHTIPCVATESAVLPKLDISGRSPKPRYMRIEFNNSSGEPPLCLAWPNFHNGCAAGLAIVPSDGQSLDASWITFNKPKGTADMSNEHAGFLFGLGLNGHLRNMPFFNVFEYLLRDNEMVSVGLLLGLAATYRGTMNIQAMKVMSIHLESLLPPTSIEMDIQQNIKDAALLGVGLIYQGSRHTHYSHMLLAEIDKPPGPDMENCMEREGYALAAGLALGLVQVGAGSEAPPYIVQSLRTYVLGGDKQLLSQNYKEKCKQGSFAVREGNIVNLDVTAPGATLALGLIYLKSGNQVVTSWLEPPATSYLLDFVRPDLLMLRCIAKGLINWSEIKPDMEWVINQIPMAVRHYCLVKPFDDKVDFETMNQAYCNIVAGTCFAIGLRFAGSGDANARDVLVHYIKHFNAISDKSIGELAGRSTLETCLCVCLLAAGMVMAGQGDLTILRLCRKLRARIMPDKRGKPNLTHGAQMAVHLTIGLLFMGGGRLTLGTSPVAIAALIAAFFPKFPVHSEDNRYHLQAFRHLYVIAAEPRLLLPRELHPGHLCYAHVQVVDLEGNLTEMRAPCMLPELSRLKEVRIKDQRFWPVVFQRDRNWEQLKQFLAKTSCIDIKPRSGCLSYLEDRHGIFTLRSETLTVQNANIWSIYPDTIELFTSDTKFRNFVENYLFNAELERYSPDGCPDCLPLNENQNPVSPSSTNPLRLPECECRGLRYRDVEFMQHLNMAAYECVVRDTIAALPIWITFLMMLRSFELDRRPYDAWQIKLLLAQMDHQQRQAQSAMCVDDREATHEPLIPYEFSLAIIQKLEDILDVYESLLIPFTNKYLGRNKALRINSWNEDISHLLAVFAVYNDLPRDALKDVECGNILEAAQLEGLTVNALDKILSLLSSRRRSFYED